MGDWRIIICKVYVGCWMILKGNWEDIGSGLKNICQLHGASPTNPLLICVLLKLILSNIIAEYFLMRKRYTSLQGKELKISSLEHLNL